MKVKMMIVAVVAMGAQYASATAPSNTGCALNSNKQNVSMKSQTDSEITVASLLNSHDAPKEVAPAAQGKK